MEDIIARRRRLRRAFMEEIYRRTDAGVGEFVQADEVARDLEMPDEETRRFLEYFHEKGWLWVDDFKAGVARITASGIDHVEALPPRA